MPSLQPKPSKPMQWLPNQVAFGVDCSDPDPKNWKTFGYLADAEAEKKVKATATQASKPSL